jgi:hypothetical protein
VQAASVILGCKLQLLQHRRNRAVQVGQLAFERHALTAVVLGHLRVMALGVPEIPRATIKISLRFRENAHPTGRSSSNRSLPLHRARLEVPVFVACLGIQSVLVARLIDVPFVDSEGAFRICTLVLGSL